MRRLLQDLGKHGVTTGAKLARTFTDAEAKRAERTARTGGGPKSGA